MKMKIKVEYNKKDLCAERAFLRILFLEIWDSQKTRLVEEFPVQGFLDFS